MKQGRSTGRQTKAEQAHQDLQRKSRAAEFSWGRVDVRGEDECWPWLGATNVWGYGDCVYAGRRSNASRAAYLDKNGGIQSGHVVCHRCDNPICCNPAHLFAATQAENLADCRRKGRARGQFKAGRKHPKPTAKLTPEKVQEARSLYAAGVSQSEIGRLWGIHSSTISRAIRGESWGDVS